MDFFKGCFIPLTCRVYFPASFWLLFQSELSDLLQVVRPDQRGAFVGYWLHLLNFVPFFHVCTSIGLGGWTQEKKGGMWLGSLRSLNGDETLRGCRNFRFSEGFLNLNS